MKTFNILFAASLLLSGSAALADGHGSTGGGDIICNKNGTDCKLFDFVEWAVDERSSVTFDARTIKNVNRVTVFYDKNLEFQIGTSNIYGNQADGNSNSKIVVADAKGAPKFKALLKQLFNDEQCATEDEMLTFNCLVAAGVTNQLAIIRAVKPEVADTIEAKMLSLRWLMVNTTLQDVTDEGTPVISKDGALQGAVRTGDIVRINAKAFKKTEYESRVGLIFHEAVYAITKDQGDKDSTRAREINALLFTVDPSGESIRKAATLLNSAN